MSDYRSPLDRIRAALAEIQQAMEDEMDAADSMDTSPHAWWGQAHPLVTQLREITDRAER